MRRFTIVEPESSGPPIGYQVIAAARLRCDVQAAFESLGVRAILVGTHIDGEDLRLYIPCLENKIILIRFLPDKAGPRIQFYQPLKRLPNEQEAEELAASAPPGTRILIAAQENLLAAVVVEMVWRGSAADLIEHLGKIGENLKQFLDLKFKQEANDD